MTPDPRQSSADHSDEVLDELFTASIPVVRSETEDDWKRLESAARAAMTRAYVPYSGFPVGAAALVDDGRIVAGCNIENASLGLTLCAECSLLSELQRTGGGRLVAFYCVDGRGEILMPCGRCRQLLWEFHAPGMTLMSAHGVKTIDEILPQAFGPEDMQRSQMAHRPQT